MFHLTHHRPTTVQVEAMPQQPRYVVFKDLAPAPTPVPVPQPEPVTRSAAMWSHVRDLVAANDAALTPMDQREDTWYSGMLARLATIHQRIRETVTLHAKWEAHWQQRITQMNQRKAATAAGLLRTAYAEGGTAQMAGLVAQVKDMIVSQAMAGSSVTA